MSNKKHKNNINHNIKVADNRPKIWCEYCTNEYYVCKGKCKTLRRNE